MGRHLPIAHLLLDAFGNQFNQSQSVHYPTDAAIELPRKLIQAVLKPLLELSKQPPFFQSRLPFGHAHRTVQHHSLSRGHWPDHRCYRIPAQLLKRRDPFVAVDYQVPVRLVGDLHHNDRRLLPHCGQRNQQAALLIGPSNPQMLQPSIEFVKFQLHWPSSSDCWFYYGPR